MISKWTEKAWPTVKRHGRVVVGVMKQAAIPVIASLLWATYTTGGRSPWDWAAFISAWGSTLAVLSILASQWFRVSKQIRDRDDFGTIHSRMDSLHTLMEGLQRNRQNTNQPPIVIREIDNAVNGELHLQPEHRLPNEMESNDFFRQAWSLFEAGQHYPAMWMAAMGYERILREQAIHIGINDASLRRIIDGLPAKYIDGSLRHELGLLNRIRNKLAHPLPYPGSTSSVDDRVEPSSVIRSFEVASRDLEGRMEYAFPRAVAPH